MIYGYSRLAQTLLERGLVDTLSFVVNPVIVGSGTALFRPGERTNLRLVSVTERRNGVVILTYTERCSATIAPAPLRGGNTLRRG